MFGRTGDILSEATGEHIGMLSDPRRMTLQPDIAAAIPGGARYAIDRRARRDTRADFEVLANLDPGSLRDLVSELARSSKQDERALGLLLMARLPGSDAVVRLSEALELEQAPIVLVAAAEALGSVPGSASSEWLARLAGHDSPDIRREVAGALYRRADAAAFAALLELARDPDVDTRGWAAWALADGFPSSEARDKALRAFLHTAPESQLATRVRGALDSAPPERLVVGRRSTGESRRMSHSNIVVLLVSANPTDSTPLALDMEVREITAGIRATPGRDVIDLRSAWAMQPGDLLRELNEHRPAVLHFSGHGGVDGELAFVDRQGATQPVTGDAILAAVSAAGESVRVVVLNACFSAELARALTQHADVALGMDRAISDDAARVFAQALYAALGHGSSVGRAFDQARAALMLEGIPEEDTPQLVARDSVDPYEVVLVDPAVVRPVDVGRQRRALAAVTAEHLEHLEHHSRLPIADGVELVREAGPVIAQRAERASVLTLGAPGSGKTGALYAFAADARAAGRDVVVLAADLLEASGRRSLSEELGLELDVVDVLAAWSGDAPGYLVIDALDATRGRDSAGVLLDLIERVAAHAGRWRVVASVRSFDLRHNLALQAAFPVHGGTHDTKSVDPAFDHVHHVLVGGLSDHELGGLAGQAPVVEQFLASAQPAIRELARVPFNLRLLVTLLERGHVDRARLSALRTQLDLLDLYWEARVQASGLGSDAREFFAQRLCEEAVDAMRLQVPRARLRREAAQGLALDELLGEGVVIEVGAAGVRRERSLGFSHHVLFDYAVHRLLLAGTPSEVAARLVANQDLVLLARPSLVLTFAATWDEGVTRQAFWDLAVRLADSDIPGIARLVGPAVAVDEAGRLDDFADLLQRVDREESCAAFVLAHVVGARVALGLPSRPLAGREDLPLWSDLARAISSRVSMETSYALRLLVWGLSTEYEQLQDDARAAMGLAARGLLEWAWSVPQGAMHEVGVGLEAVARSCATDPKESERLLARVLETERLERFGSYELRQVADELGPLTACVPSLAARVYEAAYSRDEESREPTPMGSSQILRLTSTPEQDWRMVRYALAQEYPRVIATDIRAGLAALSYACAHEAAENAFGREQQTLVIDLRGTPATVLLDHSEYWDARSYDRDVSAMLTAFEERLVEAAAAGERETVEGALQALIERPQQAAIWRRVLQAAARAPDLLVPEFVEALASPAFLRANEMRQPVLAVLSSGFAHLRSSERARVETAILAVPESYPDSGRAEGEFWRDEMLRALPEGSVQSESGRRLSAKAIAAAPSSNGLSEGGAGFLPIDDDEVFAYRGFDPKTPANAQLLDVLGPVSEFARAHSNAAPSPDEAAAAIPAIERLVASLETGAEDVELSLRHEAEGWLCEAAAALAWQTPLPVGADSVELARELALNGAHTVRPDSSKHLAEFDSAAPGWGAPSGRIDAARALLLLCREPAAVDQDVLSCVDGLAGDRHPAVRWSVARWLGLARQADEGWTSSLIERMATTEPSAQVQKALLHSVGRFVSDQPDWASTIAGAMYARELSDNRREMLLRDLARFLVGLWIWRGEDRGRALVEEWAAHIVHDAELATTVFFALREPATHGGQDEAHTAVRRRTIDVWTDVTFAAGEAFHRLSDRAKGSKLTDDQQSQLREIAQLLDTSATEFYFASGAYAESENSKRERLPVEVRERFYRETGPVLDVLASVGLPSSAHYVLQTLASFVEFDPLGVLLRVGELLEAGRAWGYQLESLAEGEFVALVERYLASHRDLLMRDRVARDVLVQALDSFVAAGWPSARRLMYGLDDMFR